MTYKEWYEKHGMQIEDALREWLETAPAAANIDELLDDQEAYIQDSLITAHNAYEADYTAHLCTMYDPKDAGIN